MAISTNQCQHVRCDRRRRLDQIGRTFFVLQCIDCGDQRSGSLAKKDMPQDVTDFDYELQAEGRRLNDVESEARAAEQQFAYWRRRSGWQEKNRQQYEQYIQSHPSWRWKRNMVLQRDGWQCRALLPGCTKSAEEAHHLTYERLFDEPLFDLVAVCRNCHQRIHARHRSEAA